MLPKLKENDYLNQGYDFWKNYRENLTKLLESTEEESKCEKTAENIVNMARKVGVKPTARYFNITPASVRYYIKKDGPTNDWFKSFYIKYRTVKVRVWYQFWWYSW